jgi:hypothetical protein
MKPRLRGVLHQYAFFASLASGTLLVLLAATTTASVAAAVYATSVSALFGVSALYHHPVSCAPTSSVPRRGIQLTWRGCRGVDCYGPWSLRRWRRATTRS